MKRKNKRHDSKGSPEKSPEKPSRRSNRHSKRKRKSSSSSSSPEREKVHSKSKDTAVVKNSSSSKSNEKVRSYTPELVTEKINKEVVEKNVEQEAGSSRRSSKRHSGNEQPDLGTTIDKVALVKKDEGGGDAGGEWKEDKSFWEGDPKVEEAVDNKGKEKDSGIVWKVQSANGAGGEIQKLKICRQRMADSQSQDESPNSPKRRSSRIKDVSQKNPDEISSDNEDQSNADSTGNEKSSKLKIRTRTSSRNSPALLDSPKVVCDVSEDNPTKIKIHIENKSPDKAPLASPVLSNIDKTEDSVVENQEPKIEEVVVKDKGSEGTDKSQAESETKKKDPVEEEQQHQENIVENNDDVKVEKNVSGENESTENREKGNEQSDEKEQEQDGVVVLDTSEIVTENIELPPETAIIVQENGTSEVKSDSIPTEKQIQMSSSSHSSTPRQEEKVTSTSGSSSEDSNDSESRGSDSDGKKVKRKKRRKDGIQSTVTRTPRAATKSPSPTEEYSSREATSGKQEPEEEGELEEGEAVEDEAEMDSKLTPVANDKENSFAVVPQSSIVSGPSEPVQKKRRWGASKTIRPPKKPVLCISTDSLKNLIPEAKPVPIEEVRLSVDEDCDKESEREEREQSIEVKEITLDDVKVKKEKKEIKRDKEKDRDRDRHGRGEKDVKEAAKEEKKSKEKKDPVNIFKIDKPHTTEKVNRRICVLSEDARKLVRSPSPARHRPSSVLFITNLVRPFTVPQLRNLLARTGKIAENGFWIDKIKSKCYVQYTDEEAAIETRHALHGVRWPVSNPRTLCVEFASYDDMAVAQALSEEVEPIPRKAEPLQIEHSVEGWLSDQARINIDRSQRRVVREWDVGKPAHPDEELDLRPSRPDYDDIRDRERERERERERDRRSKKERHPRSRTPDPHEAPVRKARRKDEDAPAKLLDDLFRKTKISPCIYWLPLTAEQIVVKEEMRRQHMAEHERRVAEMKKAEQARRDRERRRK